VVNATPQLLYPWERKNMEYIQQSSIQTFLSRRNVCIYQVQNVFLRCPTPRLHCFLSSHWPSLRFLSFMVFFIPSIQFFFSLPRALFCFGIHFSAILGSLSSAIQQKKCILNFGVKASSQMKGKGKAHPKTSHEGQDGK